MPDDYQNKTKQEIFDELMQAKQELAQFRRLLYGARSERFAVQPLAGQLELGLDTEKIEPEPEEHVETATRKRTKSKKPSRQLLPDHLPRTEIIIEPEEDTTGMTLIGQEVTEYLAKQRATTFVVRIIRPKFAKADRSGIVIGKLPVRAIEKSIADETLLADILVSKYADHLPLYRQAKILNRQGVRIASSTMSDWVRACCRLLAPLYEALKKEVLLNEYLQVDESPIRVMDKQKKGSTHRGYHWVYHAVDPKLVLFDYRKGRGRDGPRQMLKSFKGYLQTDGYGVYDDFGKNPGICLISCMAHARRYFDQARSNDPDRAEYFLEKVQMLYQLERTLRESHATPDERYSARQQMALPILRSLEQWLTEQSQKVLPKSAIGKAIHYSLKRWNKLCGYTQHGGLEIDNNLIENQIRPLALGRKNYLFAGSHQGAQNAAIIYSLLGSCQLNNLDPYKYLYVVLTKLPQYPINQISDLLPSCLRFEKPETGEYKKV